MTVYVTRPGAVVAVKWEFWAPRIIPLSSAYLSRNLSPDSPPVCADTMGEKSCQVGELLRSRQDFEGKKIAKLTKILSMCSSSSFLFRHITAYKYRNWRNKSRSSWCPQSIFFNKITKFIGKISAIRICIKKYVFLK